MRLRKSIITASALVLINSLLVGCGNTSTGTEETEVTQTEENRSGVNKAEETQKEYAVGDTVEHKGIKLTVLEVKKSQGGEYDTPKDGKEYVVVTVKYDNSSDKDLSYNPFDFKLLNSDGQKTEAEFTGFLQNTQLESGNLAAGGTVTGDLAFEAPVGDEGLYLIYTSNMFSSDEVKIKL